MGQTLSEPVVEKVCLSNAPPLLSPPRPRTEHLDPVTALATASGAALCRRECHPSGRIWLTFRRPEISKQRW